MPSKYQWTRPRTEMATRGGIGGMDEAEGLRSVTVAVLQLGCLFCWHCEELAHLDR